MLQKLRSFLSRYCNKPEGVEIARSDVIPAKAARRLSAHALARKYMNGPDKANSSPAAYLYVLCSDDTLGRYSAITRFLHRGAKPYAEMYPYPAIYFNTHFSLGLAPTEILLHEAGHVLGLANRPTHARGGHCLNPGCQMNTHRHYLFEFRWLPGRETHLCAECAAELRKRSELPSPANVHYLGPVLVRSEGDYHVASLPDRAGVLVGNYVDADCQEFASAVHAEAPGEGDGSRVYCRVKEGALEDPAKLRDILNRVKKDPSELVRMGAPKALFEACAGQYDALGQYSNAVEILQQAILWDAKDDESYNHLAWIRATCPDASIRNGAEAVCAANTACELTAWKNWQWMDTLAAAYAEAGNFKRAIELQEQALRIGNPAEPEQKDMQERLSHYKQSKPFRGK